MKNKPYKAWEENKFKHVTSLRKENILVDHKRFCGQPEYFPFLSNILLLYLHEILDVDKYKKYDEHCLCMLIPQYLQGTVYLPNSIFFRCILFSLLREVTCLNLFSSHTLYGLFFTIPLQFGFFYSSLYQNVRIEKPKIYNLKTENIQQSKWKNKWVKTGISKISSEWKENDKENLKPLKIRLTKATEKHSWRVDNWMKVIFMDESRIFIGTDNDTGTSN